MAKRILIIEDDPSSLRLISYALEQEGYQVLTASNGLAGMRKAQNEELDLVVLDLMLPGIDGFEICHRLRANAQTARLPILMLSAKAQEVDKSTGLKLGADDYLSKPADPSEIVGRVESLLARKTAAKSAIVTLLGSKGGVGTTTLVVNVAIALSQKGKRVIVLDLCPNDGNIAEHLGLKPDYSISELVMKSIDSITRRDLEAALAVHDTGVRLLGIPWSSEEYHEHISPSDVDLLLEKLREVGDYILVDLPSQPCDAGNVVLNKCDLIIIVTDFKASSLPNVKSTAALLGEFSINQERMKVVVIDREAIFPEVELSKMKPLIEPSTGVSLLGVVPYDTKASLESVPSSNPVIVSNPNCPMAWSIREVAEHIIAEKISIKDSS